MPQRIFAVLYVSIMGLTRCYKTTVFYIYICSFSTKFILQILHKPIYGVAVLLGSLVVRALDLLQLMDTSSDP